MNEKVITSKDNDLVKYAAALSEKRERARSGCFLMEGRRAVSEALAAGCVRQLIFSQTFAASEAFSLAGNGGIPTAVLSDPLFRKISGTMTPQGIAAICKIAKHDLHQVLVREDHILLLEDLRDPGNLGTVIRTAAAAGFRALIASEGCVDAYNPKVVRSTAGCLLKIKIIQCRGDLTQIAEEAKHTGFRIYAAHPRGGKDLFETEFAGKLAIALGNEANGLSSRMLRLCDQLVTIRMEAGVESLNASVAAALMMYETRRKK